MKLLLDTHTFIWWEIQRAKLLPTALAACEDFGNELWLSIAGLWEMQIKMQTGKVSFQRPLPQMVAEQQQRNGLQLLSVNPAHIYALGQLPPHHKDPFDRMLIAQAQQENMPLVSLDPVFAAYPVQLIW